MTVRIVSVILLSLSLVSCGLRESREIIIASNKIDVSKPVKEVRGDKGEVFWGYIMDTQELAEKLAVSLQEAKKIQATGECFVALNSRNFNPGESWKLYVGNLLGIAPLNYVFTANEKGELVDSQKGLELNNFLSSMCLSCPGEPNIVLLISLETQECLRLNLIPRPIEHTWDDGAKMSLVLGTPDGLVYYVYGDGFKAKELLKATSVSSGEKKNFDIPTNEDGSFYLVLQPGVVGLEGGRAVLSLTRPSCGEEKPPVKLGYSWGKALSNK